MTNLAKLLKELEEIIDLESTKPIVVLGGFIVGELLGDYDNQYADLYNHIPKLQEIGDLASDLEISNGSQSELQDMWNRIKQLVDELKSES